MGRGLGILVGAACACVIGVTLWLAWEKITPRQAELTGSARDEFAAKTKICGEVVEAFDRGNLTPANVIAGEAGAEKFVDECREFLTAPSQ